MVNGTSYAGAGSSRRLRSGPAEMNGAPRAQRGDCPEEDLMFPGPEVRIQRYPVVPDLNHHALAIAGAHIERAALASRPCAYQSPQTLQCLTDLRPFGIADCEAKVEFDHP